MATITETETHAHWDYEAKAVRFWSNRTNTVDRIRKKLEGCEGVIQDSPNSLIIPFQYVRKPDSLFRIKKERTPEQMERDRLNGLRLKESRGVAELSDFALAQLEIDDDEETEDEDL
jgi:hypothetical protein